MDKNMDYDEDTTEDDYMRDLSSDDGTQSFYDESRQRQQPLVPYNHQQQTQPFQFQLQPYQSEQPPQQTQPFQFQLQPYQSEQPPQQTQQTQPSQPSQQPSRGKRDKREKTSIINTGLGKIIRSQGREIITQLGWADQARIFGPGIEGIARYAANTSSAALMKLLEWAIWAMESTESIIDVRFILQCVAYIRAVNYVLIFLTILVKKFPRNMSQRLCDLNDKLKCIILKVSEKTKEASKVPELMQNFQDLQNALRQNISCNLGAGEGVCKNIEDDIPLSTQIKELSDDLRIPLSESIDATGNELVLLQDQAENERLLLDDHNRMREAAHREKLRMHNADKKSLRRATFRLWREEDKNKPYGGKHKSRKNKSRKNKSRKNKSRKNKSRKNKSRKHKSRKNKSRKNKSRKHKSRKHK
jgi:hypothetical protein